MTIQKGCLTFLVLSISLYQCYGQAQTDQAQCGENELWNSGFSPEPSCANMFPSVDYYSFKHGCFCKKDHIRDSSGKCIPVKNCPQFLNDPSASEPFNGIIEPKMKCPANETWREGVDPEPSCDELFPDPKGFREGCFCDADHMRNSEGKCIHMDECPAFNKWMKQEEEIQKSFGKKCVPGETFRIDCNICTCNENGLPICTLRNCSEHKCNHSDRHTHAVVENSLCGQNEVHREGFHPEATCDNLFPLVDTYDVKQSCFCIADYVRNKEGKCVRVCECPQFKWPMEARSDYELEPYQLDEVIWNQGNCLIDAKENSKFGRYSCDKAEPKLKDFDIDLYTPSKTPVVEEAPKLHLSDPLQLLESIISNHHKKKCECQVFGDYVGLKLKKVNDNQKNILMSIINSAIFQADLGNYDKPASSNNPGYSFMNKFIDY